MNIQTKFKRVTIQGTNFYKWFSPANLNLKRNGHGYILLFLCFLRQSCSVVWAEVQWHRCSTILG